MAASQVDQDLLAFHELVWESMALGVRIFDYSTSVTVAQGAVPPSLLLMRSVPESLFRNL